MATATKRKVPGATGEPAGYPANWGIVIPTVLIRSDRGYRDSLAQTVVRLREMDALAPHLADAQAVDILWFYLGHRAWHVLVSERQWSWDDAQGWLGDQVASALLKSSPA
jgi:hypothetical protein